MSKKTSNVSEPLNLSPLEKKVRYQRKYSRWPELNTKNFRLGNYHKTYWDEYSQILDKGNGIDKILSIKKLIENEIRDIQNNLDDFPEDADKIYRYRLQTNKVILGLRSSVIQKVLTHFAIHGIIETIPDFELTDDQEKALDIVCRNAQIDNKRYLLTEYLKLIRSMPKKKIRDLFHKVYGIHTQTFYKWTQDLENEMERISRTGI